MTDELQKAPANQVVTLGAQVRDIVQGTPIEKDAMIIAAMFQSGYYNDVQSVSQAITRALIGQGMGLDVVRSMNNIYITPDGKIALEAEAIKSIYTKAGYTSRAKELSNDICVLEWSKGDEVLGTSEFGKEDALMAEYIDPTCTDFPLKHNNRKITKYRRGGGQYEIDGCNCKANYKRYPKEMYLARAITRGARMFADDSFGGNAVYAKDEIEDIGQSVATPQPVEPSSAPVAEAPAKTIKSYAKAPEAVVVHEPRPQPPVVESPTPPAPVPEPPAEDPEERKAAIKAIRGAAEEMGLKPADVKQIFREVSGKDHADDMTLEQLSAAYDYLEEIERKEAAEAEARGITQTDLGVVEDIFPGAKQLPTK